MLRPARRDRAAWTGRTNLTEFDTFSAAAAIFSSECTLTSYSFPPGHCDPDQEELEKRDSEGAMVR